MAAQICICFCICICLPFDLLLVLSSCHGSKSFVVFHLNAPERRQECVFTLNFFAFFSKLFFCFAVFLVCSLIFHPVSKQCQLCVIKPSTHTPHDFISQRASVQMCLNTFCSFDLMEAWQFCPHTIHIHLLWQKRSLAYCQCYVHFLVFDDDDENDDDDDDDDNDDDDDDDDDPCLHLLQHAPQPALHQLLILMQSP